MGLWQRVRLVLAPHRAVGRRLEPLPETQQRMADLAAAIKQLELRAQQIEAEPASTRDADPGHAERQVEIIDELLDGIRQLRAALDQQRAALEAAEERVMDADRSEDDRPGG